MLGKSRKSRQLDMFDVPMTTYLDLDHELVVAGKRIDWTALETEFRGFFSDRGRPSVPLRKIIGLSLLKMRFNVSAEKALRIWLENPYWQFFCGEVHFQKEVPFSAGEFGRYKKRVGEAGMTKIQTLLAENFGNLSDATYVKYVYSRKRGTSWWSGIVSKIFSR